MKKLIRTFALQCAAVAAIAAIAHGISGCVAVEVEDYGVEVVKDAAGNPVCDTNGVVQTVRKGQRWHYNKNMVDQEFDEVNFKRDPGDAVAFFLKNYKDGVSPELNKLVDTSFKGAAELAAKIGAAIATSGGSVAGEAGYSLLRNAISTYITKGGDVEKAKITCEGGNCTITDGNVTETCENCVEM